MAKAVAKKSSAEVAAKDELPAYLQEMQGSKIVQNDGFDASDIVLPQIRLLQGTSDAVKNYETAQPGIFWHTAADMPLGKELVFIPCFRRKRVLLQAPMADGQGILARAEDAKTWDKTGEWDVQIDKKTKVKWVIDDLSVEKSGLLNWGTSDPSDEDSPPAATLFYEYLILCPEHLELGPAVTALARSSAKVAKKQLNSKIQMNMDMGRPMQALAFRARVVDDVNGDGQDFYNWQITLDGFAEKAHYEMAMSFYDTYHNVAFKVQDEDKVDEPVKAESDEY